MLTSKRLTIAIFTMLSATFLLSQITPAAASGDAQGGTLFSDDIEGNISDWSTGGFWHQVNPQGICVHDDIYPDLVSMPDGNGEACLGSAHSGSSVFWYGVDQYGTFIDAPGKFNAGLQKSNGGGRSTQPNSGSLTSPDIDLRSTNQATLYFWTKWEIEGVDVTEYDLMIVEINDGGGWKRLGTLNPLDDVNNAAHENYSSGGSKATPKWVRAAFDLSAYTGTRVNIRFTFNTVDEDYNGFRGWLIDDVIVLAEGVPPPQINGLTPNCIAANETGSGLILIRGDNFLNGAGVTVGNRPASGVSVISADTIQFIPPQLSPGTYDVEVTNPGGQDVSRNNALRVVGNANDCQPPVDVWAKDNPEDDGTIPSNTKNAAFWLSPDIIVRQQDDDVHAHQNPIKGQENYVYVRVRNRGESDAKNVKVTVYYADANVLAPYWPDRFNKIGSTTIDVDAGDDAWTDGIEWEPPATGHLCLYVRIESDDDPIGVEGDVPGENNIAQRNVHALGLPNDVSSTIAGQDVEFVVSAPPDGEHYIEILIQYPDPPDDLTINVVMPDDVMEEWEDSGGELEGGKIDNGKIEATGDNEIVIGGIPLKPGEEAEFELEVEGPIEDEFIIGVVEQVDGQPVGGNVYVYDGIRTDEAGRPLDNQNCDSDSDWFDLRCWPTWTWIAAGLCTCLCLAGVALLISVAMYFQGRNKSPGR